MSRTRVRAVASPTVAALVVSAVAGRPGAIASTATGLMKLVAAVRVVAAVVSLATRRVVATAATIISVVELVALAWAVSATSASIGTLLFAFLFRFILKLGDFEVLSQLANIRCETGVIGLTDATTLDFYALQVFDRTATLVDSVVLDETISRFERNLR